MAVQEADAGDQGFPVRRRRAAGRRRSWLPPSARAGRTRPRRRGSGPPFRRAPGRRRWCGGGRRRVGAASSNSRTVASRRRSGGSQSRSTAEAMRTSASERGPLRSSRLTQTKSSASFTALSRASRTPRPPTITARSLPGSRRRARRSAQAVKIARCSDLLAFLAPGRRGGAARRSRRPAERRTASRSASLVRNSVE